ncbi:MAG: ABC transporter ATP-binding protein [Chloroflexi bacterium]|nr:ABC transporter ATP-binding protein [Chloroflexota bacterium]
MGFVMDGGRRMLDQETSKAESLGSTIWNFLLYFRRYGMGALLSFLLILIATWAQVTAPILVGQAVDCFFVVSQDVPCDFSDENAYAIEERIHQDDSIDEGVKSAAIRRAKTAGLLQIFIRLIALYLGGAVANGLGFFTMNWTGQNVLRAMRVDLFRHLHSLSMRFYSSQNTGDLMSRITNDSNIIQQAFSFGLLSVFGGVVLMIWIVIRMIQINWTYALISLSVVPVMLIATIFFSNRARLAFRRSRREMGAVNTDLQESISGAREVQAFSREDESLSQFQVSNEANRSANVQAAVFTSALTPVLEALGFVALSIVVFSGGLILLSGEQSFGGKAFAIGTVFVFIQYILRFNQPIQQIATLWANIQSAIAGGERIFQLLAVPAEITDAADAVELPPIQGHVEFDQVSAAYEPGEMVLNEVSFQAQPGQMIAIVGPTGAGKTTAVNLLPRLYDVVAGAVRIDGYDVREVTLDSLRSQIGVVMQDTFLFSGSVLENVRFGKLDASDEEVIDAIQLASADAFVARLPDGYHTELGERGSGLSLGQRQLIAIARVALMNPNLLILDEATSSVDTRTERTIQAAFDQLLEGRTSFVIAHRLSTIRNADQVLMIDEGRIVERGTHQELLDKKGAYSELYFSQFRSLEEEEASP